MRFLRNRSGFTLIELMVVVGIAAILITMAGTSFFGAMRQESVTKSRNQLRDAILLARQQACMMGKTHVVICWNADSKVVVGSKEQTTKQGRYAVFQSVGTVWHEGRELIAPFGVQREILGASLKKNARAISLFNPDASTFMRIDEYNDNTMDNDDNNRRLGSKRKRALDLDYWVAGQRKTVRLSASEEDLEIGDPNQKRTNPGFWIASLKGSAPSDKAFPLAVRTTATFSLPKQYAFNNDRAVFIFNPDGSVGSGSASSISAAHSTSKNAKNATFSLSIDGDGKITLR